MRIKKYLKFLNEDLKSDIQSNLKSENKDLKETIIDKIVKSLNSEERDVFDEFIEAIIKDDSKNQIEGLINDSDVYEFYLSYRNEIDELLSDVNFYDEKPSDMSSFSLYDYLVKGTKRAIKEIVIQIKEETKTVGTQEKEETTEE
jgi:hypothetical protein